MLPPNYLSAASPLLISPSFIKLTLNKLLEQAKRDSTKKKRHQMHKLTLKT